MTRTGTDPASIIDEGLIKTNPRAVAKTTGRGY